ncbi:MAG: VCBS repeat-containing protein [Planctomycetota bacterium]
MSLRALLAFVLLLISIHLGVGAEPPEPKWNPVQIDQIQIGYGLQMADVDGDGLTDVILADKKTIQWYEAPKWTKHVVAKDLTERDNVCITARDIDGDGKCEIAVGGQWNYRESVKDGAVFYLDPPSDRKQLWKPVELHHEPSIHRMHWVRVSEDECRLVVKPLRGRGSQNGEGAGIRVLEYARPKDPNAEWPYTTICDFLHLSHNFHVVDWDEDPEEELVVAAKEGVWHFDRQDEQWKATQLTNQWAGEVRDGRLPGGRRFIVTIEPMHGSESAVYLEPPEGTGVWERASVLDASLKDGHALACADFLGVGYDQIVVGWRAMNDPGVPGIKFFTPLDEAGDEWRESVGSSGKVAVEDIKVADLNQDGKIDVIAAARQTKNLVIFFNMRP